MIHLPTRDLHNILDPSMKEGDEFHFVFRKTDGFVNVVHFSAEFPEDRIQEDAPDDVL